MAVEATKSMNQDKKFKNEVERLVADSSGDDTFNESLSNQVFQTEEYPSVKSCLTPGTVIANHYEVLSVIGYGASGTVYKVKHLLVDQIRAAKLLHPSFSNDPKVWRRFQQEAKSSLLLEHPNIVRVYEFGIETKLQQPYMVMDYVSGKPLNTILKEDGPLDETRTCALISEVCYALAHSHSKGVVHRDIKPGNIIVTDESRTKVVDFGIAKLTTTEEGQHLTKTGEVFGTPLYMSPEQCLGQRVDGRSDVYSLGCVLYECLTGRVPFEGDNSVQTIFKHINDKPERFKSISTKLASLGNLETIVLKCLEKKSDERYQSVDDLLQDLRAFQQGHSPAIAKRFTPNRKTIATICMGILIPALLFSMATFSPNPVWRRYWNAANSQWNQGPDHYAQAEQAFKLAAANINLEKDKVPKDSAQEFHLQMGRFYHQWGKDQSAVESYLKALDVPGLEQSPKSQEVRKALLASLIQTGDYASAIEEGSIALRAFERTSTVSETQIETAYLLGNAFRAKNQYEKAKESYLTAYGAAKKLHPHADSRLQAIAAQSLAYVMSDLKQVDSALRYGLESLAIFKKTQGVVANETQTMATWLSAYASEHGHPDVAQAVRSEYGLH